MTSCLPYSFTVQKYLDSTIVIFEISSREFIKIQGFVYKLKYLNLVSKLPCMCIFRLKVENTIVLFEISGLESFNMQSFLKNKKLQIWHQWVFLGCKFKKYCHI